MLSAEECLRRLRAAAEPGGKEGMARFGIDPARALGVRVPHIRRIAKEAGRDHKLAAALWKSGIHEARILASMVDEPDKVTPAQMDRWAKAFDSWDVCDQCCMNLFDRTPHAWAKALEWSRREEEFVKRAGLALMACLAWHDKAAPDKAFAPFFPAIERAAEDPRNFVKKAASWALRQTGKRSPGLHRQAMKSARGLSKAGAPAARWVGKDALRELERKPQAASARRSGAE